MPEDDAIIEQINRFEQDSEIRVTQRGKEFIAQLLSALAEEPNAGWRRVSSEDRMEVSSQYTEYVRHFLYQAAVDSAVRNGKLRPPFRRLPWWYFTDGPYYEGDLRRLLQDARVKELSYFDLLHWVADNLGWLNPFPRTAE